MVIISPGATGPDRKLALLTKAPKLGTTTSTTFTVWLPLGRLEEEIVIVPVYDPAVSVASTEALSPTINVAGVAPLGGVAVKKLATSLSTAVAALKGKLPPVLATWRAWAGIGVFVPA